MILILTGINLLTYFKGKVTTMLVANSRELRFIIIGSDFKWESITAEGTVPGGHGAGLLHLAGDEIFFAES